MAVLVDSAVIIGFLVRSDGGHARARTLVPSLLAGEHGDPSITDHIADEVLTYLVARGASRTHIDRAIAFMIGNGDAPGATTLHKVGADHFAEALRLVRRYREKRLSFTDCTSLAVMASVGIPRIASFDAGFDGLVERIH